MRPMEQNLHARVTPLESARPLPVVTLMQTVVLDDNQDSQSIQQSKFYATSPRTSAHKTSITRHNHQEMWASSEVVVTVRISSKACSSPRRVSQEERDYDLLLVYHESKSHATCIRTCQGNGSGMEWNSQNKIQSNRREKEKGMPTWKKNTCPLPRGQKKVTGLFSSSRWTS